MNGKQLKNSILQWAIQGKLVPQDPNDEPASVLLEKIRQEKERLIKEKKIKRDKNASIIYRGEDNSYYEKILATGEVKCIDEEIPFEVPKGWEWCRLRDIIKGTNAGKSPNCEKRPKREDEWGVLTTTAIQENDFLPTENKVLPPNYIVNPEHSVKHGDILITRAGPVNRTGVVCLVDKECNNLILSDKTVRIDYLRNYCNPIFIVLVLNSPTIHELLMSVTVGMASSQVNVSQDNIQNTLIPFPCIKMQNRIVEKITNLLPIIERYKSEQEQLEELNAQLSSSLKKSILQEAIQGRLVPQIEEEGTAQELLDQIQAEKQRLVKEGKLKKSALTSSVIYKGDDNKYYEQTGSEIACIDDTVPFDLPTSWCWVRHNQLFEVSGGSQPPKSHFIDHYREGYIRLYQIRDYGSNPEPVYVPINEISKTTRKGDILLARYGGSLGKVFWAEEGAYNVAMAKVIPLYKSELIHKEYIFLYYCSNIYQSAILDHSRSAQAGFNKDDLADMLFPLPPYSEQVRIVERYQSIVTSIMRG